MGMRVGVYVGFFLALLGAGAVQAEESAESSLTLEASAGHGYGLWSLLGDVGVGKTTFLTLGYTGARPEAGTAAIHQLSVGVDHLAGEHWLLSGAISLGLPKGSNTQLTPELPQIGRAHV